MKKTIISVGAILALSLGVASAQSVNVQFADYNFGVKGTHFFVPSVSVAGQYRLQNTGNVPVTVAGKLGLKANVPGYVEDWNYRAYGAVQLAAKYNNATLYVGAERDLIGGANTVLKAGVLFGNPVFFYGDK